MSEPKATYIEDEYVFVWDDIDIKLTLERFREERGELKADCQPQSASRGGVLPAEKLNLSSARSLKQYANTLGGYGLLDSDQWFEVLTQACELSKRRYREGSPAVRLSEVDWRNRPQFVIYPYIEARGTTIWFGDGGVSKSIHTLAACVSVATGAEVIPGGIPRISGPVLYADWEADEETHAERLAALCKGLEIAVPANIFYKRCTASIGESVRELRRLIASEGVVFAGIDSIGGASGGDVEKADSVIRTMMGIRALEVPALGVHHITKDQKDKTKPFGSVYGPNLARLTWRFDKDQDAGSDLVRVRLTNFKGNNVRLLTSQGHGVRFTNRAVGDEEFLEEVAFTKVSGLALPAVTPRGKVVKSVMRVLRETAGLTYDEIVDRSGEKYNSVYQALKNPALFQQQGEQWYLTAIENGNSVDFDLLEKSIDFPPSPIRDGNQDRQVAESPF